MREGEMIRHLHKLVAIGLCFALIGCASGVQRIKESPSYSYNGEKYSKVELSINKNATKDPNDIVRFDDKKLRDMIERKLEVCGLLSEKSVNKVKIEITDVRIRSTFNAFMWGFLAGNDHIRGNVALVGENDKPLHTFHVSASYALGGFAGFNETRMGWLFEEFSKLTLDEIAGEKAKKVDR
jgi:hypothetical protein